MFRKHQPHAVCPVCKGSGKKEEGSRKRCEVCQGYGYLDQIQYGQHMEAAAAGNAESNGEGTEVPETAGAAAE